jgi:ComF family protein
MSLSLPTQCAVCRGWERQRVCHACSERFGAAVPRCRRCALRVPDGTGVCGACLADPPPCDRVLAALDYAHPWDRLIGQFKFDAALDLAGVFVQRIEQAWRDSGSPRPQLLLPVPLSPTRLRERGYNQSWEIVRRLARRLHCPADAGLLLRIRDTAHQLSFPVERRAANVQSAFAIEPRRLAEVRGRSVTLFDDVMTTGATVAEIARTLRRAGAAEVHAWVLARTPAPGE